MDDPSAAGGGQSDITTLLRAWRAGSEPAFRQLSALLYEELRRQAHRFARRESRADGLQTTEIVHEAFLRLAEAKEVDWTDRSHFLAVAARVMRRLLVDLARAHDAQKRGGEFVHVTLDAEVPARASAVADVLAVHEALDRLGALDQRKADVVELRVFGGLTVPETADALGVSADTVARDWRFARAWLVRALTTSATGD